MTCVFVAELRLHDFRNEDKQEVTPQLLAVRTISRVLSDRR